MLREDLKALANTSGRDLRKFGLVVGAVFCAVGIWFLFRQKPFYWYPLAAGVPLVVLGAILPRALKWIYVGWMVLALALGTIVSTVLLTMLFYLLVTPIGLLARAAGNDFLSRKREPNAATYWIPRDVSRTKPKHEHERQF